MAAEQVGIRATRAPYVADEPGYDYFETRPSPRTCRCSSRIGSGSDGRVRSWVGLEHLEYGSPKCFRDAMIPAQGRSRSHRPVTHQRCPGAVRIAL